WRASPAGSAYVGLADGEAGLSIRLEAVRTARLSRRCSSARVYVTTSNAPEAETLVVAGGETGHAHGQGESRSRGARSRSSPKRRRRPLAAGQDLAEKQKILEEAATPVRTWPSTAAATASRRRRRC